MHSFERFQQSRVNPPRQIGEELCIWPNEWCFLHITIGSSNVLGQTVVAIGLHRCTLFSTAMPYNTGLIGASVRDIRLLSGLPPLPLTCLVHVYYNLERRDCKRREVIAKGNR